MGVNRGTRVGQPPWVGFGVESASLGIGVPLDPQGASRQAEALTSRGAFPANGGHPSENLGPLAFLVL